MGNVSFIDGHIDEVKMTNYDRITKMSVDEMAEEYSKLYPPYEADLYGNVKLVTGINLDMFRHTVKMTAIKWLLQEVTDNDNT